VLSGDAAFRGKETKDDLALLNNLTHIHTIIVITNVTIQRCGYSNVVMATLKWHNPAIE